YSGLYSKTGISSSLNRLFLCFVSIISLIFSSSHTPSRIYLSSTAYVNPRFSSSVFPHRPSIGVLSTNFDGSQSSFLIIFTSVTVRRERGLKSPTESPYLVEYPTQSSDRLQVFTTLPFRD